MTSVAPSARGARLDVAASTRLRDVEAHLATLVNEALLRKSRVDMPALRGGNGNLIYGANVKKATSDWITVCLRSISHPAWVGEEDDARLLPAVDAWLGFAARSSRPVDSCDTHGNTLMMIAALFGKARTVQRLLARGADPDRLNKAGKSAIVYAVMGPDLPKQKLAIVGALLGAGARARARAITPHTPCAHGTPQSHSVQIREREGGGG